MPMPRSNLARSTSSSLARGRRGRRRPAAPGGWSARTFAQNKLALLGVGLIVVADPVQLPRTDHLQHRPARPEPDRVNQPPGGGYLLGTDSERLRHPRPADGGRAELDRGRAGGRRRLDACSGSIYGAISGYFGGALDGVLMRIVDVGLAIPIVFLFIFMAQIFKPTLTLLIVLLVVVSWLIPARLVRGETLTPADPRVRAGRAGAWADARGGSSSATSSRTRSARSW